MGVIPISVILMRLGILLPMTRWERVSKKLCTIIREKIPGLPCLMEPVQLKPRDVVQLPLPL